MRALSSSIVRQFLGLRKRRNTPNKPSMSSCVLPRKRGGVRYFTLQVRACVSGKLTNGVPDNSGVFEDALAHLEKINHGARGGRGV